MGSLGIKTVTLLKTGIYLFDKLCYINIKILLIIITSLAYFDKIYYNILNIAILK